MPCSAISATTRHAQHCREPAIASPAFSPGEYTPGPAVRFGQHGQCSTQRIAAAPIPTQIAHSGKTIRNNRTPS